MATLQEQLQYAVDTKDLIKDAIKRKGVEVPDNTVFRDYPGKIDAIPAAFTPEWQMNASGQWTDLSYIKDQLIIPTEQDGAPASTTFTYSGNPAAFWYVRKIIWPEYYLSVSLNTVFPANINVNRESHIEELEINAVTIAQADNRYTGALRYIKGITFNKYVNSGEGFKPNFLTDKPISNTFYLKSPTMQRLPEFYIGTADHPVALTLDLPNLLVIGGNTNTGGAQTTARYCTGEWEFPKATLWFQWATPHGEQTLKLPSLVEQRWGTSFTQTDTGILHLYLGPKVKLIESAANFKAHPANLDIHIPAGESTTKATLDAAGLPYTQDYVI